MIVAGHIALALIPGMLGVGVGLVLIALGSGGLKANATSVVGTLYAPDDTRRDAGFSLFYLGINLGRAVAGWADAREERTGTRARVLESIMDTLTG